MDIQELMRINQAIEDLYRLISHQQLCLRAIIESSPPELIKIIRRFMITNITQQQSLTAVYREVNQTIFEEMYLLKGGNS